MKVFWQKFKAFWKELGNILTNILCPVVSALCAIAELVHLPVCVIEGLKKAEYWLFYACATKPLVDEMVEEVEAALEDDKLTLEECKGLADKGKEVVDTIKEEVKNSK